ncbi:MAG: zinc-finger domain-containing protein [Myxococcales bacterium]|nr:zinc-finger domain-containing protein [Myxococcales bacterium]USN51778.1 MAG: zinc-finger domain-containing protein [Myxococcales bacterium]
MKKTNTKQTICAQCKKNFELNSVPTSAHPFCSKRCKMIDLGQWLSEKYVLEANNDEANAPLDTEE